MNRGRFNPWPKARKLENACYKLRIAASDIETCCAHFEQEAQNNRENRVLKSVIYAFQTLGFIDTKSEEFKKLAVNKALELYEAQFVES